MNRFFMAAFAVSLLIASTPVEARTRHFFTNHTTHRIAAQKNSPTIDQGRVILDVAALPAYSLELTRNGPRQRAEPMGRKHIAPSNGPSMALGDGIVRSGKTGATAHVSPAHAAAFQAYINDLEANGAIVRFMGGYRKGPCWSGGLHPCGKALDVCQTSRGVVDPRCSLPGRLAMISIAARHGLTEGGIWCHSDMGHVQTEMTAAPCGKNLYAAVGDFQDGRKIKIRHASHHHRRYAST